MLKRRDAQAGRDRADRRLLGLVRTAAPDHQAHRTVPEFPRVLLGVKIIFPRKEVSTEPEAVHRPVRDDWWQIWRARGRKMGNGHRKDQAAASEGPFSTYRDRLGR